jgi:RNA polymerase sigma-70 factor (ECF subfamily)
MEMVLDDKATQFVAESAPDADLPLLEATLNGDIAAFEQLVKRYERKLLRVAQQITHNIEDAQDVVQDTFLKVYTELAKFERKSKFSTWLMRIAINESLMKIRKGRRFAQQVPLDHEGPDGETIPFDLADWSPNPEQLFDRTELHGILRKALEGLRPTLRLVFVLRDLEELSIAETAAVLDLNPTTVKARLLRARLQLREALSKYFKKPQGHTAASV